MALWARLLVVGGLFLGAYSSQAQEQSAGSDPIYTYVEQMPVFPGGQAALNQTLGQAILYPTEALQQRLEGRVFVRFVVDAGGKVQQVQAAKGVHPVLDAEAIRAVSSLPAFTPGKKDGQRVAVAYTLPITFKLPANVEAALARRTNPTPPIAATDIAQFPSGPAALAAYLAAVPYPEAARANQTTGRVFIQFKISANGKVEDVEALQPTTKPERRKAKLQASAAISTEPSTIFTAAAESLVAAMPTWTPAVLNGTAVDSYQTVPVSFSPTPPVPAPSPVYAYADQMPTFAGVTAQQPLQASIQRTIRYPAEALRAGAGGQALVYFVVNEKGQIAQAEIIRSVHPAIDTEVLRAVRAQQIIAPALHQNKPVAVFYILPINFAVVR